MIVNVLPTGVVVMVPVLCCVYPIVIIPKLVSVLVSQVVVVPLILWLAKPVVMVVVERVKGQKRKSKHALPTAPVPPIPARVKLAVTAVVVLVLVPRVVK